MGTFSSETAANRHYSGKFDFIRFAKWPDMASPAFLVFKIGQGKNPRTSLQGVDMEKLHLFSNQTSASRQNMCYHDTSHCPVLAICLWLTNS